MMTTSTTVMTLLAWVRNREEFEAIRSEPEPAPTAVESRGACTGRAVSCSPAGGYSTTVPGAVLDVRPASSSTTRDDGAGSAEPSMMLRIERLDGGLLVLDGWGLASRYFALDPCNSAKRASRRRS